MWGGPRPDPGGEKLLETESSVCTQELTDLKDQFDQQQVLIAQLKEMLRKSEQTAVMQEKVEEYANTLTRMNARVKKSKLKRDVDIPDSSVCLDTPSKEKIQLLRQQMEQNKLKLAERGKLHKGIEETVTQLKAQVDDSQLFINQAAVSLSIIDPKEVNYSINSSQEELFNFLVVKDRRICDLNTKIQKLEASVLDLQENVKEKDSVIDARTKAITLMTESLSKKGKTTLDALDETKEQMRNMQENFITLETKMNNEKQLLADQLEVKTSENNLLQKLCDERNNELQKIKNESGRKRGKKGNQKTQPIELKECHEHLLKIAQYEDTITELNLTIEELKALQVQAKDNELSETVNIKQMKKQLDENNKNMIKMKAQHKSKIKELNKSIDDLRKGKDFNAEVKRLQDENAKLAEEVSKLTFSKDLVTSEHVTELEMNLLEQSALVESKNQVITTLEEQISAYKTQIEQLEKFSRLENDQVVSEIQYIDFEEQLDKSQFEKKEILQRYDNVVTEKTILLETIDSLNKEKQELSLKLDNYIQENIELIDKLEKLSSAKVSSAESIEIVEGLTQQEKLELEEYQKGLEIPENIKSSVENLESAGLNESVNQLTEETSDLLRKIELFTEERREVMDKMEALAIENSNLNMKICELENNRDILAETYEQVQNEKEDLETSLEQEKQKVKDLESSLLEKIATLQNENDILQEKINIENMKDKCNIESNDVQQNAIGFNSNLQSQIDEYKALIEIQKQEILQLRVELLSQQNATLAHSKLQDEISVLQTQYQALLLENEALTKNVKENSELIHEKDILKNELITAKKRIEEFAKKLNDNLEEIENYKSILDENKNELISSANIINDLQSKVQTKQNEIQHYENEIERLNSILTDLNSKIVNFEYENTQNLETVQTIEVMSNQLQELKGILNENIKQIEKYEEEIQSNSESMNQLTLQIKDTQTKLNNMELELSNKKDEILTLVQEKAVKESVIKELQQELKEKEQNFYEACEKFKEKYVALQNKIDENSGSFDKLNLPKISELESRNKEQLEKMKKIAASLKKKNLAYQELQLKFIDLEKNHNTISEEVNLKASEIERLQAQISHSQDMAKEAQVHDFYECDVLNADISRKNNLIKTLTDELEELRSSTEANSNALQAKIQELEMYIETQDSELSKHKEHVDRLEDGLSALEERRQSLERQAIELGNQLQEKSNSYEEITQIEDILEQRLATLIAQDKKLENRLRDSTVENQTLHESNKYLLEDNEQLKLKLSHALERNIEAEKVSDLEQEIQHLKEVNNKMNDDFKRRHAEYEKKLTEKASEVDNMESELLSQLTELTTERKNLMVQCEHLKEEVKDHVETQQLLNCDIDDFKNKLAQQQADFEAHLGSSQKLYDENKTNLNMIDALHRQIISYTVEIESLKTALSEKIGEIENCHLQNQQLRSGIDLLQEEYNVSCKQCDDFRSTNLELLAQIDKLMIDNKTDDFVSAETPKNSVTTFKWPDQIGTNPFDSIVTTQTPTNDYQSRESAQPQVFNYFDTPSVTLNESKTIKSQTDFLNDVGSQTTKKTFQDQYINTETVIQEIREPLLKEQKVDHETNEELINKLKTLEFMLYTVEREKEDVLQQCQQLTAQIAQLIYEKQVSTSQEAMFTTEDCKQLQKFEFTSNQDGNIETPIEEAREQNKLPVNVESEIISSDDVCITEDDLQQLHSIEFEKYEPNKKCEDVCESESAYLCYPVNKEPIESQIITKNEASITKSDLQKLKTAEFTKCKEIKDTVSQNVPVSEPIQAKTAYLCFKNDEVFDENDDGWGCGSDEAKLEADYHQVSQDNTQLLALKERICQLEVECDNYREESNQFRIKSNKLLKKLKEYKTINDKLETEVRKSGEFAGLEDALQEELKIQISQLEKRLKEMGIELEKERTYKNSILKQVDVLQAANERMVEMKEKQDCEMITWQRQNRELSSKLEQFEWGNDDSISPKHESQQPDDKITELTAVITELTKDNEDLQILLEEQRNLRIAAERSKVESKHDEEYLTVIVDKNRLESELMASLSEKKALHDDFNNLIKENIEAKENLDSANREKLLLENQVLEKCTEIEKFHANHENIKTLQNTIEELQTEILSLKEHNIDMQQQLDKLNESKMQLTSCEQLLQMKTVELLETTSKLDIAIEEKSALADSIKLLNDEWILKVDQRGCDVAESWKLHLESRETEFSNIQDDLKKEISDLEEKYKVLVNENNELRKSVDAEIRNDIDQISSLQQQLKDNQLYINDMSRIVQANQIEIEQNKLKISELDIALQQLKEENDILTLTVTQKLEIIKDLEENLSDLRVHKKDLENKNEIVENIEVELMSKTKLLNENLVLLELSNKELAEYKESISLFQQQIDSKDEYISELAQSVHEYQTQCKLLNDQLNEKDAKIETLKFSSQNQDEENDHVLKLNNLQKLLQETEHEFEKTKALLDSHIEELKLCRHSEDVSKEMVCAKVIELDNIKVQLVELNNSNSILKQEQVRLEEVINDTTLKLYDKIQECEELHKKIYEQECLHCEESKQISELGGIIEDQVLRIEAQKQELFEKSKDYDSLIAELDIRKPSSVTEQISLPPELLKGSEVKQSSSVISHSSNEDLLKPISQAELDLALYMLHQRDVRCEELTVELVQLLEERDTLQLKLSNAIREKEAFRSKILLSKSQTQLDKDELTDTTIVPASPGKVSAIVLGASGTEIATEAVESSLESTSPLADKISELRRVGYHRDKTLLDEQEQRRLQQIALMQDHRDIAALLPPEAAAKLVQDASYTLSRDIQSPSKVLLNWLWGRSTPKVNNV